MSAGPGAAGGSALQGLLDDRLCEAARAGDEARLRALLGQGADARAFRKDLGASVMSAQGPKWPLRTALMQAAAAGSAGCAAILAKAGGADMRDPEGWCALSLAARHRHARCVMEIAPHCSPEVQLSAIYSAANEGSLACLEPLLALRDARGGEVERGFTALMLAAGASRPIGVKGSERMACVRALLPHSDPMAEDHDGFGAAGHARRRGDEALAELIESYALAMEEAKQVGRAASPGADAPSRRL